MVDRFFRLHPKLIKMNLLHVGRNAFAWKFPHCGRKSLLGKVDEHITLMNVNPVCKAAIFLQNVISEYASELRKKRSIDLIINRDNCSAKLRPVNGQQKPLGILSSENNALSKPLRWRKVLPSTSAPHLICYKTQNQSSFKIHVFHTDWASFHLSRSKYNRREYIWNGEE